MSAHIPRKVFAQSFVVTVAALPVVALACHHEDEMSHNPPMPTETATAPTATATASSSAVATPSAVATSDKNWTVTKDAGKCSAHDEMACPLAVLCNPPLPLAYACPADVPFNSYPLKVVQASGSQECKATFTDYGGGGNCPRGMTCNPPPPHLVTLTVPCPH